MRFIPLCRVTSGGQILKSSRKFTPDAPKNENGLIQMIGMGKSICHKWVNTGLQ